MNIKKTEKYKDTFYLINFVAPSIWHVLEAQKNVYGRKGGREGGQGEGTQEGKEGGGREEIKETGKERREEGEGLRGGRERGRKGREGREGGICLIQSPPGQEIPTPSSKYMYFPFHSPCQLFSFSSRARKEVRRGKECFSFGSADQGSLPPGNLK